MTRAPAPQPAPLSPFSYLKTRQVRRRYRSALTIYLASYTHRHLSHADQNCISYWIRHLIDSNCAVRFSFKEFELFLPGHIGSPMSKNVAEIKRIC
jgi:hypothetical protein